MTGATVTQTQTTGSSKCFEKSFFVTVLPKQLGGKQALSKKTISFPCYWILLKTNKQELVLKKSFLQELSYALEKTLVDPLLEVLSIIQLENVKELQGVWTNVGYKTLALKQFLPGITDNLGHVVEEALLLQNLPYELKVASGRGYLSKTEGEDDFSDSQYKLYHPIIENFTILSLKDQDWANQFPHFPIVHLKESTSTQTVDLNVDNAKLEEISRTRMLALSTQEMLALRDYFGRTSVQTEREALGLPPQPTEVDLEVIAQTWSEHCKHKIFNAHINYVENLNGKDTTKQHINSLYKTFIQQPTKELQNKRDDLLSVFEDNSGVVRWDNDNAVCFKVETHNSPCALEPYGGSLTGILGVNRDILGTGLGARPIFNTDILCFAHPQRDLVCRPKLLPPETIVENVRKGIQDGGNKSGIPTVNGAIVFHDGYRAKPLVFCGTGGVLPITIDGVDALKKHTKVTDIIVMAGGRVGKDGIHGATFSSEALHEGSPVSAVQIGDPFTQKRLIDFVVEARDKGLITGITDNGAGGLSSSVGEMAQLTGGAHLDLKQVPLKYPGLADWEIVVSESQERMTISTDNYEALRKIAKKHNVEVSAVGTFTNSGKFEVSRDGKLVCALDLEFLHKGLPTFQLEAEWLPSKPKSSSKATTVNDSHNLNDILLQLLSHPNIANREVVIRQYDHEVQASSVIKPLMGEKQSAPCDAAVITPLLNATSGLAIANGIQPRLSAIDPYAMAVSAVDEAVRNLVCVGADPSTISLLDNFCWPDPVESSSNPKGKRFLGALVRACKGLAYAVKTFEAPLISGKDSMKNDFDDGVVRISIPPTLLISGIARVPDINQCISMEFKCGGDIIYLIHAGKVATAQSCYAEVIGDQDDKIEWLDVAQAKAAYCALHQAIRHEYVNSAHDVSDGGLAVTLAECTIGSGKGAHIFLSNLLSKSGHQAQEVLLFGEGPGCIAVSIQPKFQSEFEHLFDPKLLSKLGVVIDNPHFEIYADIDQEIPLINLSIDELTRSWNSPLPFSCADGVSTIKQESNHD